MNHTSNQSYLDLSVHPELRGEVLSRQPVVVFSDDLRQVVWSNAAGAQLFGGTGIVDLLAMEISPTNPIVTQLQSAAKQLHDNEAIIRGFRINRGLRSQMLQFRIERIEQYLQFPHIKITLLQDDDTEPATENLLATAAVNSLDGFADAAAIIDDFGLPLYASEKFEVLGPDENTLAQLVNELMSEPDRLIKRPITLTEQILVAIGLARISDQPGRNLVVIAESAKTSITDIESSVGIENQGNEQELEDQTSETFFDEDIQTGFEEFNSPEQLSDSPMEVQTEVVDIPDGDGDSSVAATADDRSTTESKAVDADDVRFAWSTDAAGKFTYVSEELAEVVGQGPADLVGREWVRVAKVLGLDPNGEIEELLQKHDTWSGKTVLWPIENSDRVVPVDLAALPIFGTDRDFQGFRGYGKIMVSNRQHDPEGIGNAFSDLGPTVTEEQGFNETVEKSDIEPEIKIFGIEPETEANEKTNVVSFDQFREQKPVDQLTDAERKALATVRATLTHENPEERQQEPVAPPSSDDLVDTSLLEKLPVAVLVYRNGETLFANKSLFQVSGHDTLNEIIEAGGVSGLLIADEDEHDNPRHYLKQKDGSTVPINAVLHSVHWKGNKALLLSFPPPVDTVPDALELTRISEVQNVLDTTTDGILLLDTEGKIISINASGEALFGLDFDDAVGHELSHLFANESKSTIDQYVSNILGLGIDGLINDGEEAIALEANGGFIPVFVSIARMEKTGKLCAVIRDITSWKKTEEELIQSKQRAELASEQKSDFLARVSHEIRTPLNAIVGFSDLMIEERFGPINNERYKEYLNDIRRSGVHVLDIINELLDLAKIEAGKLDLTFEAVNLNELVAETVAMLQPQANSNRTIIRTSLSRIVPKVVADPRSIRQVILNLVSNAIKFSETNSQVIVSTVYESNGEVALRVRDTGIGMTESEIENAMKPFQQVHKLSENSEPSTGLGLPLTKALVEANRAFFDLESSPGNGTIAHVQFPTQRVLVE